MRALQVRHHEQGMQELRRVHVRCFDNGDCCVLRRGKLLNVRDASVTQINGNAEINAIKQILGLQHGKVRGARCQTAACMGK